MFVIVTTMNTPKTTRTPVTITDCARATNFAPTMFSAVMAMIRSVMNRWSHFVLAPSPMNSDLA